MPGIWDHKIQIWKREYKISVSKAIKDIKVGNKTLREKMWKTDLKISQIEILEMNIIITEIKKSTD